jgi:hypothetical protein
VSLLKVYQVIIIPATKSEIVNKYNDNGNKKVYIVEKEDGAVLHTDKTYLAEMNKIFEKKDWLIFNQPSQSPITNVHDTCIFLMMSKTISRH